MVFTNISPFPSVMTPITNISPLTYRDASTFLEYLETIKEWLNETLVPDSNAMIENAITEFQTGINNAEEMVTLRGSEWQARFDLFMENVTAELKALNDAAVAAMVNDTQSAVYAAINTAVNNLIDAEIASVRAYIDSEITEVLTVVQGVETTLRGETTALGTTLRNEADVTEADLRAAIAAGGGGSVSKESAPLEYNEDFTQRANGAITTALTGQTYSFLGPAITVTNGFASFANTDEGGAYASVQLDGDAIWLGGEFKFTPFTADGGIAVFAMTEEDIKATQNAGQGLPRMSAHVCVTPKEISVDVLTTKGGSVTRIWTHPFATQLASDDVQVYSAWIALDRLNGIAHVIDPLGEIHSIQHTGFKIPSRWIFFEPFRNLGNPTTKTLPKFGRIQADSRDTSRQAALTPLAKLQTFRSTKDIYPTSYTNLTLLGTHQPIAGTLTSITVPSTGKIRARITAFLNITSSTGAVFFNVVDTAGTGVIEARTAGTNPDHSGWRTVEMLISGLTAGSIFTGQFSATALSGATATMPYGTDASLNRYGITFTLEAAR